MKKELIINVAISCLFSFAVLIAGCNENRHEDADISTIEIVVPDYHSDKSRSKEVDFSIFCDSLIYIPLQTIDESIISNIDRVYYTNQYVYVLDRRRNKLLQFTTKGQFIKQIGAMGRGPGEYSSIFDFTLNSTNGNLILLCEYKVIEMKSDGAIEKEQKLEKIYHSFLQINNSLWLFPYDGDYCATLMDYTNGEVIDYAIPRRHDEIRNMYHGYRNVTYDSNILFVDYWDYMVYTFTSKEAIPYYNIDFGKRSVSRALMNNNQRMTNKDFIAYLKNNNYIYHISNFIEGNRYVFFRFEPGRFAFYDKKTLESTVASIFDDETTGLYLSHFVESSSSETNYLTNALQPRNLIRSKKYLNKNSSDKNLIKILESLNEGDNPVLMRYNLR